MQQKTKQTLELFDSLSMKFGSTSKKTVVHENKRWTSQQYFSTLAELKQLLDDDGVDLPRITNAYQKYISYIPRIY